MKIVCPELLTDFRSAPVCAWCGTPTPAGCDPMHIYARGMGGGSRLDIPANIVPGCRFCHTDSHAGHAPLKHDLLALVAARYGTLQDDVIAEIFRARRLKKGSVYVCGFTGWTWKDGVALGYTDGAPHAHHRHHQQGEALGKGADDPLRLDVPGRAPGRGNAADVAADEARPGWCPF